MKFKLPRNDERFVWTNHSVDKMRQYQLSEQRVRSVLNSFKRKEEGIAPNTVAVMQATGSVKHPTEIWVMYQSLNQNNKPARNASKTSLLGLRGGLGKKRIISTWRYPGVSPIKTVPDIPEEAWDALDGKDDIK